MEGLAGVVTGGISLLVQIVLAALSALLVITALPLTSLTGKMHALQYVVVSKTLPSDHPFFDIL